MPRARAVLVPEMRVLMAKAVWRETDPSPDARAAQSFGTAARPRTSACGTVDGEAQGEAPVSQRHRRLRRSGPAPLLPCVPNDLRGQAAEFPAPVPNRTKLHSSRIESCARDSFQRFVPAAAGPAALAVIAPDHPGRFMPISRAFAISPGTQSSLGINLVWAEFHDDWSAALSFPFLHKTPHSRIALAILPPGLRSGCASLAIIIVGIARRRDSPSPHASSWRLPVAAT